MSSLRPPLVDHKTEEVKWPTIDVAHEDAAALVKARKRKKKKGEEENRFSGSAADYPNKGLDGY